jgi:SAM-dependent methyltransferase
VGSKDNGGPHYSDRLASSRFGTHRMIAERVAAGERVLDVGAGEGALALALKSKGCKVVCIEVDPGQAEAARAKGLEVRVHNIEKEGLEGMGLFDIVVCADVLEHLMDPEGALKKLKGALAPHGRLLASIPNVAFYGVRLRLLAGRWDYTDTGILDRTHLRFYTRKTSRRLLEDAGLSVRFESITLAPPTSALPAVVSGWQKLLENRTWGTAVHRALSVAPGFFGSQFVFEAVPK